MSVSSSRQSAKIVYRCTFNKANDLSVEVDEESSNSKDSAVGAVSLFGTHASSRVANNSGVCNPRIAQKQVTKTKTQGGGGGRGKRGGRMLR